MGWYNEEGQQVYDYTDPDRDTNYDYEYLYGSHKGATGEFEFNDYKAPKIKRSPFCRKDYIDCIAGLWEVDKKTPPEERDAAYYAGKYYRFLFYAYRKHESSPIFSEVSNDEYRKLLISADWHEKRYNQICERNYQRRLEEQERQYEIFKLRAEAVGWKYKLWQLDEEELQELEREKGIR